MRTLLVTATVLASAMVAHARVWTTVYRCDGVTPLESIDPNHPTTYRDIMVGTHLVIVLTSDTGGDWWGRLQHSTEDSNSLSVHGRGYDSLTGTYTGSRLPAAGIDADVWPVIEMGVNGFEVYVDSRRAIPGDWFVFDYYARKVGASTLGLYDLDISLDVPVSGFSLVHVPSRDLNGDAIVDFNDFARLASRWRNVADPKPDNTEACDFDASGLTDLNDLILFSQYWLDRADCEAPAVDPNDSSER